MNVRDDFGRTALMLASSYGNLDIVRMLLRHHEADVDAAAAAYDGATALIEASKGGHLEAARVIMKHKKVNANA